MSARLFEDSQNVAELLVGPHGCERAAEERQEITQWSLILTETKEIARREVAGMRNRNKSESQCIKSIKGVVYLRVNEDQVFGKNEANEVAAVFVKYGNAAVSSFEDLGQHLLIVR